MKKKFFAIFLILLFINLFSLNAQSSSTSTTSAEPEPYNLSTVPQWLLDVRDTEIITFGSLPFVMLGTTLVFSFINVANHNYDFSYFSNPFARSDSYSKDQQMQIILTSALVSTGIGLTNLSINLIKRGIDKKNQQTTLQQNVKILEIKNDFEIIPIPQKYKREKNYLYGNIENAVF